MERIVNPTSDFFVRYLLGSEENKEILLDFVLFKDLKKAHSCFLATEKNETDYVLTDDFQIHFFELPKMDMKIKALNNRLEKWAFFFTKEGLLSEEEEMKILIKNDPIMENAHKTYKKFAADDELLQVYEAREKRLHDEATRLSDAKEEGLKEGLQKGLHETARKMQDLGVAVDIISKSTGLTEKEIQEL